MSSTVKTILLSNAEKLRLFSSLFTGLRHVYGTYDPDTGRSWQVKRPMTAEVLLDHLCGRRPAGVYLLTGSCTRAMVIDFDTGNLDPVISFVAGARHYGMPSYIERSKCKGYHVWVFFPANGVSAAKARRVATHILDESGQPEAEVFPKQDRLASGSFGNFINLPLFGRLVPVGRTVFVREEDPRRPHEDQWAFLSGVHRVPEHLLDEIIEINGLGDLPADARTGASVPARPSPRYSFGLPLCAQRMLAEGVTSMQRVACFRLAAHLNRVGVPLDLAVHVLRAWAAKNRPSGGKRRITHREIHSQAVYAYERGYRGYGCRDPAILPFCDRSRCPLGASHDNHLTTERNKEMSEKRPPDQEYRAGSVRASIWAEEVEQDGRRFRNHTIKIDKRYRDEAGEWKSTQYFFPNDLPRLALVASKAFEYAVLASREEDDQEPGDT